MRDTESVADAKYTAFLEDLDIILMSTNSVHEVAERLGVKKDSLFMRINRRHLDILEPDDTHITGGPLRYRFRADSRARVATALVAHTERMAAALLERAATMERMREQAKYRAAERSRKSRANRKVKAIDDQIPEWSPVEDTSESKLPIDQHEDLPVLLVGRYVPYRTKSYS